MYSDKENCVGGKVACWRSCAGVIMLEIILCWRYLLEVNLLVGAHVLLVCTGDHVLLHAEDRMLPSGLSSLLYCSVGAQKQKRERKKIYIHRNTLSTLPDRWPDTDAG